MFIIKSDLDRVDFNFKGCCFLLFDELRLPHTPAQKLMKLAELNIFHTRITTIQVKKKKGGGRGS